MMKDELNKWFIGKYKQFILWRKKRKTSYIAAPWHKKVLRIGLNLFLLFFLYLFVVDINFLWLFGKSPGLNNISNPQQNEASEIYSADGVLIGKYFKENRTPVRYIDIAPIMIKTLVTTEDERFYQHMGIDVQGIFSAIKDISQGKPRGASTITQQLVKNMYQTRSRYSKGLFGYIPGVSLVIMKTKEWITAFKIELFYSKEEILTMYFNTVDFGSNAFGIKTACKTYFNNTPNEITIEQAATLVGLLKATTTYNPRINPENSKKRRNVVLENLVNHHIITQHVCDSLQQISIKLQYNVEQNYDGNALYFREAVSDYLNDWCKKNDIDLYADGLKIYTTLDSRMQEYAEQAVNKQMRIVQRNFNSHWGKEAPWRDEKRQVINNFVEDIAKKTSTYKNLKLEYPNSPDSIWNALNKPHKTKVFDYKKGQRDTTISILDSIRYMERILHAGFVALEPNTGFVKAWIGDIDFNFWKYDKVTSCRQPGSTFKLFVYAAALNKGLSPCDKRIDQYIAWDYIEKGEKKRWIPRNANWEFTNEPITLKYAFARSFNSVAVQLAREVGIKNIIRTAHAMGIKSELEQNPALSLGSSDVSLIELVNAYCTVINDGKTHDPVLVTYVVDKDGKTIYKHQPEEKQALSYETAFLMTELLRAGLTEPLATSQALWAFDIFRYNTEFGGKTGTSSNHSDAWFVGVSPKLVGGSWVGGEHRCIHFRTGQLGEGSKTALPIFGYFMEKVMKDKTLKQYRAKFPKPTKRISKSYQCRTPYPEKLKDSLDMVIDSVLIE